MHAKQFSFVRLHKFVESDVAFTPAQIAAVTYTAIIASAAAGAKQYPIPASITGTSTGVVTVPFSELGFTPKPGENYVVQVVATLDGVDSPASSPVTFSNSFTPAGVASVTIS